MMKAPELIIERIGEAAVLTLDRSRALNALSETMLQALADSLKEFSQDTGVNRVVLSSNEKRAFCAGADIRAMHDHIKKGDQDRAIAYFEREYALDKRLADFPKPVFAMVDGLCLGAGMGLALHSRHCVATPTAQFAMPETAIGFFPDAGASYFLNVLPQHLSLYLALTGARLSGADAAQLGLINHCVSEEEFDSIVDAVIKIGEGGLPEQDMPDTLSFADHLPAIERCFVDYDLEVILSTLDAEQSQWAKNVSETLRLASPTSLAWTVELMRQNRDLPLAQCLRNETGLMRVAMHHPDFAEGVRAMLIDKDRTPRWQ